MTAIEEARPGRVISSDGTPVAYWTSGNGPSLVLVHGTGSLHATWNAVLPHLTRHRTVHAVDRRGRSASGDNPAYAIEREFEDIAAVVDQVAGSFETEVDLLGHSFGGVCAFGAAALTPNIRRLVLYEGWPPVTADAGPETIVADRMVALLAGGDRDRALETFMVDVAMLTPDDLAAFKKMPGWWEARTGLVHTIPRELRAELIFTPDMAAVVDVPTLLIVGSESANHLKAGFETVADALPNARITVLEGQDHLAHIAEPELFARHLLAFLQESS